MPKQTAIDAASSQLKANPHLIETNHHLAHPRNTGLTATGPLSIKAKGPFRTDNGEALRDACCQGLGIAINSTWSAYQQLQRGELVQILEEYPLLSDTAIWAVYPSSRQLAPKVRAFIDYFAQTFGDPPYWDQAV